jgi:hypothetical protein
MLIKSGTSYTKYRFEQHKQSLGTFKSLNVADNITLGGTVDGHDIDSELDTLNGRVNQAVNTTSSPTFANATISGHNVDTQLDRINQDVKTTASPTFVNVNAKVNNAEFYNGAKRGIRPINQTTTLSEICNKLKDYYPYNNYQLNLSGVIIFGGDTYIPFFSTGHLLNGVITDISIETINLSTNEKTTLSVTPSDSTSAYIYLVI